jgi:hypothetical protein
VHEEQGPYVENHGRKWVLVGIVCHGLRTALPLRVLFAVFRRCTDTFPSRGVESVIELGVAVATSCFWTDQLSLEILIIGVLECDGVYELVAKKLFAVPNLTMNLLNKTKAEVRHVRRYKAGTLSSSENRKNKCLIFKLSFCNATSFLSQKRPEGEKCQTLVKTIIHPP